LLITTVDEKAGFIRLPASYVKRKSEPECSNLGKPQAVLVELRQELKSVMHISNRVFTQAGRPIKESARKAAQIEDLNLHDLRLPP
jgi:hypothetical protein